MSSTKPLKRYLEARDALARGDRDQAVEAVKDAFGSQPDNPYIERHVERLVDHETEAGEVLLDLVRAEMNRRDDDD
jgi:hypothetical protein